MVNEIKWDKAGLFPQKTREPKTALTEKVSVAKITENKSVETENLKLNHLMGLINVTGIGSGENNSVQEIKDKINSNQYNIDYEKLSKKMLESEILSLT